MVRLMSPHDRVGPPGSKAAARHGAVLLAAGAAVAVGAARLVADPGEGAALTAAAIVALAAALVAATLPWERWPEGATLALLVPAFGLLAAAGRYGGASLGTRGLGFVLVFVWLGLHHRPGVPLTTAALTAPLHLLSSVGSASAPSEVVASAAMALPVCAVVGETVARSASRMRRATRAAFRRADLLRVIADTSRSAHALAPDAVVRAVTSAVAGLGFEAAYFAVYDPGAHSYRVAWGEGVPEGHLGSIHSLREGVAGLVWDRREPVVIQNYRRHPRALPLLVAAGCRTAIGAPIWVRGRLVAALVGGSRAKVRISSEEMEAFGVLASVGEQAFSNARQVEEERRAARATLDAARRDELTGVGNRREGEALLSSLRPGDALALVDVDHFKRVNDRHGHLAGDRVLATLGLYLKARMREGDGVARFGGEEFLVVLRGAGDDSLRVVQRLVVGWRAERAAATFSAGVAVHDGGSPSNTFRRADAALYAAKRDGRDRVGWWDRAAGRPGTTPSRRSADARAPVTVRGGQRGPATVAGGGHAPATVGGATRGAAIVEDVRAPIAVRGHAARASGPSSTGRAPDRPPDGGLSIEVVPKAAVTRAGGWTQGSLLVEAVPDAAGAARVEDLRPAS